MQKAEELARQHGYMIVPPYNDEQIIAGQGTVGLEILEDCPDVDLVLVPVGGGGLISGVSAAIKLSGSKAKVIGVEPELANDAQQSFRKGEIVELPAERVSSTLADGLRTQSVGRLNFEHMRKFVDDIITVTEDEIRTAMRQIDSERAHRCRAQRRGHVCGVAVSWSGAARVEEGGRRSQRRKRRAAIAGAGIDGSEQLAIAIATAPDGWLYQHGSATGLSCRG